MQHKTSITKRLLSVLLTLIMAAGLLPTMSFASYEDGTECEFCGHYRYDDWLCDCGPHCSENADDDCYDRHHCDDCGEAFDEDHICEDCGLCYGCAFENLHCRMCGEHSDSLCDGCTCCDNCISEYQMHCVECGDCLYDGDVCDTHSFDFGQENHCAACAEWYTCETCGKCYFGDEDSLCEECHICNDCWESVDEHCSVCLKHSDDICPECTLCPDCQVNTHCELCGDCMEAVEACPTHEYTYGPGNHCAECMVDLICIGCEQCYKDYDAEYCEEHAMCLICCILNDLHCSFCGACGEEYELCLEGEWGSHCLDCGLSEGFHCEECEEHVDEWCPSGGEGSHCAVCAEEFLCEECGECAACLGREFCDDCGLCNECCRNAAAEEGCSCLEYCIYSSDWEAHMCPDCGEFFCNVEQCETCGLCLDCCAGYSECSDGLCVEDPDYEEHFCEDCERCFCDVDLCDDCANAGLRICVECCADRSEAEGCEHGVCMNSWEWPEHFCEICHACFGSPSCNHEPDEHTHDYDDDGNCIICGFSEDGVPVITKQPADVSAHVSDVDAEDFTTSNFVSFRVKAIGENLTYQWYMSENGGAWKKVDDAKHYAYDVMEYSGAQTEKLTFWLDTECCGTYRQFYCIVTNTDGSVTSDTARLTIEHLPTPKWYYQQTLVSYAFIDPTDTSAGKIPVYESEGHFHWCIGEGCGEYLDEAPHRYGDWYIGAPSTTEVGGYKYRFCLDCGFKEIVHLSRIMPGHEHDTSYEMSYDAAGHWGRCKCGYEDHDRQAHSLVDWTTVEPATASQTGKEERKCSVCGYTETRTTPKKSHTHDYWDYLEVSTDPTLEETSSGSGVFVGERGKIDAKYHYAYCKEPGCNSVKKENHRYNAGSMIIVPTPTSEGVLHQECGLCMHSRDTKIPYGTIRLIVLNGYTKTPAARPGAKVKLYPYEQYPEGVFFNDGFSAYFTRSNGTPGEWETLDVEHHRPDDDDPHEYWWFRVPAMNKNEISDDGFDWDHVWVEVEADLIDHRYEAYGEHSDWERDHFLRLLNEVEATCTHPGYSGDLVWTCCNLVEEYGEVTEQLDHGEHGFEIVNKFEGSCTKKSYTGDKQCNDCGKIYERGTYGDYKHSGITTRPEQPATCTAAGRTAETYCADCGKTITAGKTISKAPHTWDPVEEHEADCTEKGIHAHYKCKVCGALSLDGENVIRNTAALTIPAGHLYGEWISDGETHHIRVCERNSEHTDRKKHTFVEGVCTVCGAETAATTYTVTLNSGANGTASVSESNATEGTKITVTATPNSGYEIDKITYTSEGGVETDITSDPRFTMPAAKVTVTVSFKASPVTPVTVTGISIAAPGKTAYTVGEALDVSGMKIKVDYSDGTSATIPITAAMVTGFDSSAPAASQTLTITYEGKTTTYDVSISATAPVTYDVTVNAGAGGTASASASNATEGTKITVTATPNSGYEIDKITYTSESGSETDITSNKSFTMPAANVTVNVSFKASSVTPPDTITYTVTGGADSIWTKGSSDTVTITVKRSEADDTCFSHFTGVEIDGTALAAGDYEAVSGSTVITLKASALQKLSDGDHTVTVKFDDGNVSTGLTVKATPGSTDTPTSPQTGDDGNLRLWVIIMLLSISGFIAAVAVGKKKSQHSRNR